MSDLARLLENLGTAVTRLSQRVGKLEKQESQGLTTGLIGWLGSFSDTTAQDVDDQVLAVLGRPAIDGITVIYYSTGDSDVLVMTRSGGDWNGFNVSDGSSESRT